MVDVEIWILEELLTKVAVVEESRTVGCIDLVEAGAVCTVSVRFAS